MSDFLRRLLGQSRSPKSSTRKISRQLAIETLEVRAVPSVAGTVFEDLNGNGVIDGGAGERGVAGVSVTARTLSGTPVATATTNARGSYSLATPAGQYQVTFTNIPTAYFAGLGGDAAYLFVRDGQAANLALNTRQFIQTNPGVVTSEQSFGDSIATTTIGTTTKTGSTAGLAFNPVTGDVYAASFTKKHAAFGPAGPSGSPTGVVYQYGADGKPSVFADLNALGLGTVAGRDFRAGYTTGNQLNRDSGNVAWDAVGKTGLGGIDVSADGKRVYVMNLADRQLYALGVNATTGAFDGKFYRVSIPNAAAVTGATRGAADPDLRGDLRPFAVQVHNGKIYVGVVNSAESTKRAGDVRVMVFEATDTGTGLRLKAKPVLNASLGSGGWQAWSKTFATVGKPGAGVYPQAWLTGISFDAAGGMQLTIKDRSGDQFGLRTLDDPNSTVAYTAAPAADTLRATGDAATGFTLAAAAPQVARIGALAPVATAPGVQGRLFTDSNFNGLQDRREGNLEGITVRLFNSANGQQAGIDVTGSDGLFTFDSSNVPGGGPRVGQTYEIRIDLNQDRLNDQWSPTLGNVGNNDDIDSDGAQPFVNANIVIPLLISSPDQIITNIDQGFVPGGGPAPYSIGNRIWEDLNRDGVRQDNEPGIDGVTVRLYEDDNADGIPDGPAVRTDVTDEGGYYRFDQLTPETIASIDKFIVEVDTTAASLNGLSPTINAVQNADNDVDNDHNGFFVGAGTLRSGVVTLGPGNSEPTGEKDLAPTDPGSINSRSNLTVDFGFVRPDVKYSVGNRLWNDGDRNGVINDGEQGLNDLTVRLYRDANADGKADGAPIASVQSANGGYYRFDDLDAGNYIVEVDYSNLPDDFVSTKNGPGANSDIDNDDDGVVQVDATTVRSSVVTLGPGDSEPTNETDLGTGSGAPNARSNLTVDFGFFAPPPPPVKYSVGNRLWNDGDRNGVINDGEQGLNDLTVRLYRDANADGKADGAPIASVQSANGGYYRFDDLDAGNYIVEVDYSNLPDDFVSTKNGPGANSDIDNDDDGVVQVDATTVRSSVVTLGPGDSEPTNETDLGTGSGAPNARSNLTVDFGFFAPPPPPVTYSVGNKVWIDTNKDGNIDAGEPGVDGVTVRLISNGKTVATDTTAGGGYYRFDGLAAGNYFVEVVTTGTLSKYVSTIDGPGANSDIDSDDDGLVVGATTVRSTVVTLGPGDSEPTNEKDLGPGDPGAPNNRSNLTVDFGFVLPPPVTYSLGNKVWNDTNKDGNIDAGESGIDGVTVRLLRDGAVIGTDVTAGGGYYRFDNLAADNYVVEVVTTGTLSKYVSTIDGPGANSDIDSDDDGLVVGATTVRSTVVTLGPGNSEPTNEKDLGPGDPGAPNSRSNLTVDFGFFLPPPPPATYSVGNKVWIDTNKDGNIDAGEPGVDGVTVRLISNGKTVATDTTAGGGYYRFDGLDAGNYFVEVVTTGTLSKYVSTIDGPGANSDIDSDDDGLVVGATTVRSTVVTLGPGNSEPTNETDLGPGDPGAPNNRSNLTVDFGFFLPTPPPVTYSLGNKVWLDTNRDGNIDAGERGIDGVTIQLYRDSNGDNVPDGGVIAKDVTSGGGYYRFDNLTADTYIVEVVRSGPVAVLGTTIFGGDPDNNIDSDSNGALNKGLVRSFPVTLGPGDSEPTNETDLGPGDPGAPNNRSNLTVDFGFVAPLADEPYFLGNRVWLDTDKNGLLDNGEKGIDGVTVNLYRDTNGDGKADGGVIKTDVTTSGGYYNFAGLTKGDYVVEVVRNGPIAGLASTKDGATPNADIDNDDNGTIVTTTTVRSGVVTLGPGDSEPTNETDFGPGDAGQPDARSNLTVDFGFVPNPPPPPPLLSLGNLVWFDTNNDGVRQPGEAGAVGVAVTLTKGGQFVGKTTTDSKGEYLFTGLKAGDYVVEITPPVFAGNIRYLSSSGTGVDGKGNPVLGNGPFEPAPSPNNNVDNDDNGTRQSTTSIIALPVTLSPNAEPTSEDGDPNSNLTVDFGLIRPQPLPDVINRLSGYVYRDTTVIDGQRTPENGETGIGGTTITLTGVLTDGTTITRTTTTDREGFYQFTDLPNGTYTINETQPRGNWIDGIDTPGRGGSNQTLVGNDVLRVSLAGGQNSIENNFGEVLPFSPNGYVYFDPNKNGTRESGEPGIPNVPINLQGTDFRGNTVTQSTTTNADGYYSFVNVPPGTYSITNVNPAGFIDGPEENVDPNGPTIIVGTNIFQQVTPASPYQPLRGPLNFSLQSPSVTVVVDPSKQDFLASSNRGTRTTTALPIPPVGRANAVGDSPSVPLDPSFNTTTAREGEAFPLPTLVATGNGEGATPTVRVFDYANGVELYRFNAYGDTFTGGVAVATGDVDGDGIEDIVTAPGKGGGPQINVYSGATGQSIRSFFAYDASYRGGVYVSIGDINGDGVGEIITGTGVGGGPHVQVYTATGTQLMNFFAYDSSFRGGVRVGAGDLDGDGRDDIITGAGTGGSQHVKAYSGATGGQFLNFIVDGSTRGGAWVTGADVNGDGRDELVTAAGQGSNVVRAYNGVGGLVNQFASYEAAVSNGIRLASADIDGDGEDEVITVPSRGASNVKFFDSMTGGVVDSFFNIDPGFLNGSFVG